MSLGGAVPGLIANLSKLQRLYVSWLRNVFVFRFILFLKVYRILMIGHYHIISSLQSIQIYSTWRISRHCMLSILNLQNHHLSSCVAIWVVILSMEPSQTNLDHLQSFNFCAISPPVSCLFFNASARDLYINHFIGTIPSSIANLTQLIRLYLFPLLNSHSYHYLYHAIIGWSLNQCLS
jgi:hypothetical protein